MKKIELRAGAFPYLSTEELAEYDGNKSDDIRTAQTLNQDRHDADIEKQAVEFTRIARQTEDELMNTNKSHVDQLRTYVEKTKGDSIAAIDMFLYNNGEFLAELNENLKQRAIRKGQTPSTSINYLNFAAKAGKSEFKRYKEIHSRALMLTTDDPGAENTIDLTVAQSILFRSQNLGNVIPLLGQIQLPFGDYDEPFYNKYAAAGYLTETGTVPDFNTELSDGSDGIKKTRWTPRDFAFGLEQSFRTLTKLSPSILADIFSFLQDALTAGMEFQALSGPGTGQTDSGILTVATAIADAGNPYLTFVNAVSDVETNRANDIVAFMNAKAWGEFKKLRVINEAYRASISTGQNRAIDEVPVVVVDSDVITTTANVTSVLVGAPEDYLIVTSGQMNQFVHDQAELLQRFTTFHVLRDGDARFDDSFAKFTVNV